MQDSSNLREIEPTDPVSFPMKSPFVSMTRQLDGTIRLCRDLLPAFLMLGLPLSNLLQLADNLRDAENQFYRNSINNVLCQLSVVHCKYQ